MLLVAKTTTKVPKEFGYNATKHIPLVKMVKKNLFHFYYLFKFLSSWLLHLTTSGIAYYNSPSYCSRSKSYQGDAIETI